MTASMLHASNDPSISENRDLLPSMLWGSLIDRIVVDHQLDRLLAERILDQAVSFLRLCAANPEGSYSPSSTVDIGWHAFILHTREYAEFCARVAGFFIHHAPTEEVAAGSCSVVSTMVDLESYGLPLDRDLWHDSADCTTGHKGTGGDCIKPPRGIADMA